MLIPHGKAYFYRILNKFQPKIEKLIFKLSKAYTYFPFYVVNTREQKVLNNSETVMKYIFKPESYFFIIIFNYFFYLLFWVGVVGNNLQRLSIAEYSPPLKLGKLNTYLNLICSGYSYLGGHSIYLLNSMFTYFCLPA